MPSSPAPKSVEFTYQSVVGASNNPFTGQQQIYNWNANWTEISITMPPMDAADAAAWVNFFIACNGMANVFQLANSTFAGLVPAAANVNGYWRLKTNMSKWSINEGTIYGAQFEIREAI
jgi:hypothetical protein